jgi:hypothetical protein
VALVQWFKLAVLNGIFQIEFQIADQCLRADVEKFIQDLKPDPFLAIVKPISSAGSDGVLFY